jgi:hypothetical protein
MAKYSELKSKVLETHESDQILETKEEDKA